MIKTIIFDFGGIFSENADSWSTMYKRVREKTGLTIGTFDEIFDENWIEMSLGIKDFPEFLEKLVRQSKNKVTEKELLEIYSSDIRINKAVLKIVKDLKNKGYRVIILSNESKTGERVRLKKIEKFVDKIYSSATIGLRKPDPKIFKYVFSKENLKIGQALLIDDKERNVIAAKDLGIKAIVYKNPEQLKEDLNKFLH